MILRQRPQELVDVAQTAVCEAIGPDRVIELSVEILAQRPKPLLQGHLDVVRLDRLEVIGRIVALRLCRWTLRVLVGAHVR